MGARQSKGSEAGSGPFQGFWRRAQGSVLLRSSSSERPENPGVPAPYRRRVGMIQDVLLRAKEGRQEEAGELLKSLRQVNLKIRFFFFCNISNSFLQRMPSRLILLSLGHLTVSSSCPFR